MQFLAKGHLKNVLRFFVPIIFQGLAHFTYVHEELIQKHFGRTSETPWEIFAFDATQRMKGKCSNKRGMAILPAQCPSMPSVSVALGGVVLPCGVAWRRWHCELSDSQRWARHPLHDTRPSSKRTRPALRKTRPQRKRERLPRTEQLVAPRCPAVGTIGAAEKSTTAPRQGATAAVFWSFF